jgi:hypothetical protein
MVQNCGVGNFVSPSLPRGPLVHIRSSHHSEWARLSRRQGDGGRCPFAWRPLVVDAARAPGRAVTGSLAAAAGRSAGCLRGGGTATPWACRFGLARRSGPRRRRPGASARPPRASSRMAAAPPPCRRARRRTKVVETRALDRSGHVGGDAVGGPALLDGEGVPGGRRRGGPAVIDRSLRSALLAGEPVGVMVPLHSCGRRTPRSCRPHPGAGRTTRTAPGG